MPPKSKPVPAKTKAAPPKAKVRDGARTRRLILEAAFEEFTAKGLAGARMESVAERAGVNVRAIYQHFDSKDGLYEAVFGDSFSGKHSGVLEAIAGVLADPSTADTLLPAFHEFLAGNPAFSRLMVWDALMASSDDSTHQIVAPDVRRDLYAQEIELLRNAQRADGIWTGMDADLLLVAFMGMAIYPHVTAPLTEMITGLSSDSPEFRTRWNDFLQRLGSVMASGERPPAQVERLPDDSADDNRLLRVAARALGRAGLVTAYGHVSLRLNEEAFLVCAPMPLGLITNERGTIVPIDGPLPEGVLGEVRAHQAIYRRRPDVNAIARVIPHSVRSLSTLGRTARPIDGFSSYFAPEPPLWNDPQLIRDDERAHQLAETLGDAPAVVMRGNGAVVVADTLPKAVVLARYLEDASAVNLAALATGEDPIVMSAKEATARAVFTGDLVERMWAYMTSGDPEA